jgi:hypothetical protein
MANTLLATARNLKQDWTRFESGTCSVEILAFSTEAHSSTLLSSRTISPD